MVVLKVHTEIPANTEQAKSLARYAIPWNQPVDLICFCHRNREVYFDPHVGDFV